MKKVILRVNAFKQGLKLIEFFRYLSEKGGI